MIEAKLAHSAEAFVARLTRRARRLGMARAEALLAERRGHGERRWRLARLLWPLFAKD